MAFIDYYKILGVSKDIPQKDVKKAYLKRAKQFHPDLHPNDPKAKAKFQALNEAYTVINEVAALGATSAATPISCTLVAIWAVASALSSKTCSERVGDGRIWQGLNSNLPRPLWRLTCIPPCWGER